MGEKATHSYVATNIIFVCEEGGGGACIGLYWCDVMDRILVWLIWFL